MSKENIDLYERVTSALNTHEISDELADELLARDFYLENLSTAVTEKTYHGAEGLREWVSDTFEGLDDDTRYESEEILAEGDDFVVGRVHLVGHGARSRVPVTLRWVVVAWFQDGKMTRGAGYLSRREALEAVGLEM